MFDQNGNAIQAKRVITDTDSYVYAGIASSGGDRFVLTERQATADSDRYNIITKSFDNEGNQEARYSQQITNRAGFPYIVSAPLPRVAATQSIPHVNDNLSFPLSVTA